MGGMGRRRKRRPNCIMQQERGKSGRSLWAKLANGHGLDIGQYLAMMDLSSKFIHSTHPWGSLFRKWNVFREVCSHINIYLLCVSTMDEFSPRKIGGSSFRLVCVKGCVELERSRITRERKELNGNPFSSVYDSRCYELWRRERNVYLLASRCSNLEEWLIVLFLQTMYLAPLGIFSPWDVLWPCFILLFRTPSSSFDIVFSFAMYYKVSWIIFSDLWVLATMINFLVRKNLIISLIISYYFIIYCKKAF